MDVIDIHTRVADELSRFVDGGLADVARAQLVTPRAAVLPWDYGEDQPFPGVIVAEWPEENVGIAYSEDPFGARTPWLLVALDPPAFRYDAYGFDSLEEAVKAVLV